MSKITLGFVNWPEPTTDTYDDAEGYVDSGEGGTECWFVFRWNTRESPLDVRQVCMTGFTIGVMTWNAICTDSFAHAVQSAERDPRFGARPLAGGKARGQMPLDGAVCVGASQMSIFDLERGTYWEPGFHDLTDEGKSLFKLLGSLYGAEPEIVMVLDT